MHRIMIFRTPLRLAESVLGAMLLFSGPALSAALLDFSGPVQPIQITQTLDQIQYQVFDPARGVVSGQETISGFINVVNADGVLAWSDSTQVRLRTYNPATGAWVSLDVTGVARSDLQTAHGVVAWSTANRVYMVVYDQSRQEWKGRDLAPFNAPLDLTTAHGLAAWSSSSPFSTAVQFAAYDAVNGVWIDRATQFNQVVTIQDLSAVAGLVAWTVQGTVYFRAFDPRSATWIESFATDAGSVFDLVVGDGILAWSQNSLVRAVIYDATRSAFRGGSFPPSAFVTNLRISNGSVLWSGGGTSRSAGYNVNSGNWDLTTSAPRAYFGMSRTSGNAPFGVYFFDMSFGASTWSWNFGDGTPSSNRRSPYHRFESFASNVVRLTISSPTGGVFAATNGILSDIEKPTGSVVINDGDAFTTNALVTLALSAADNSGQVASMRFSNDGTSWSTWEAFAASKSWIVASATGENTVHAQFRDAALNVSDSVSDSILVDTTPPPTIQFVPANLFVQENAGVLPVEIKLSHAFTREVSVDVFSTPSSAAENLDYSGINQRIVFEAGQTNRLISVTIQNDTEIELNETFFLSLGNPTNGVASGPATITILDDDQPSITFAASRFPVREDIESGEATITVQLTAPTGLTVEVDYLTAAGTAEAGVDYENRSAHLIFAPGVTEQTFTVPILQDDLDEVTETVLLTLRNPINAPFGAPASAVLEILDEDPPVARFTSSQFFTRENAPNGAPIEVELSTPFDQNVVLNYSLTAITAVAGGDYFNFATPLQIPPGQTNITLFVNLNNDNVPENDETMRVTLTVFNNATPGTPIETILTIEDDDRPRFHSPRQLPGGSFETQLASAFGINVQVQVTTNFSQWAILTNIFGAPTNALIIDPAAAFLPHRFYRAIVP